MKSNLTKVSLALLSAVFILGCQDLGTAVEGVDLVPQFDKKGDGTCNVEGEPERHCHGDEDDTGGDDPGSPFYQYTLTSSVITTDPSTAIGVSGSPSGKQVSLSETRNSGPSFGDEKLKLSELLLDNSGTEREKCFGGALFTTGSWGGHVSPIKQGGNEVWANFLFDAMDKAGDSIGYRLRLFGTAVTTGGANAGDGIFPPEVGETMTVAFTSYFIEPQRNKEKNACSGAADLDANHPLATRIAILGVPNAM